MRVSTKFVVLLSLAVTGCESNPAKNYYSSEDVTWGEPVQLTEYLGKQFAVIRGGGPGGYQMFPLRVPRDDGSITYLVKVQFQPDYLRMTSYCIYQNHSQAIVLTLTAEVDASGDQVDNGYVIYQSQENKTEWDGTKCGVQIASGKYLFLRNKNSLRMYSDSKNYLELAPHDAPPPLAPAENKECPALEELRAISKTEQRRIALSPAAFEQVERSCRGAQSPPVVLEAKVLDWHVFYTSTEDINEMSDLGERNLVVLRSNLRERPLS
jgi:hypothetical protein